MGQSVGEADEGIHDNNNYVAKRRCGDFAVVVRDSAGDGAGGWEERHTGLLFRGAHGYEVVGFWRRLLMSVMKAAVSFKKGRKKDKRRKYGDMSAR